MEERNDEIDLIELSRNIMVRVYHYFIRRFMLLAVFGAVGVILGITSYVMKRGSYENKIRVVTNSINTVVLSNLFNSLDDIRKSDIASFSNIMNIDSAMADNIIEIKSDTITAYAKGKQIVEISLSYKEGFDNKKFTGSLKQYIDNNPFVIKGIKLRRKSSTTLIKKYQDEIKKLTSLQEKILSSNTSSNQSGKLLVLDDKPINFFHKDILSLEKNIIQEEEELDFLNEGGFLVVDENEGVKIRNVSLVKTVLKFFGIFLGLGFIVTIILEFIRQVKYIESIDS